MLNYISQYHSLFKHEENDWLFEENQLQKKKKDT